MTDAPKPSTKRPSGIALVTALISGLIAVVLITILSVSVLTEMRSGRNISTRNQLAQAADGVSEQARLQVLLDYKNSKKSAVTYLRSVNQTLTSAPKRGTVALGSGMSGVWQVTNTSRDGDTYGWLEIHASVSRGSENQTVIRRVSFGQSRLFELAMLSEKTNCMYCHLRVNGDVGSLDFLRPGWGNEGVDGQGSGGSDGGSKIYGDVYVAPCRYKNTSDQCTDSSGSTVLDADGNNVSSDSTNLSGSPKTINGAQVTNAVNTKYTGSKLPQDLDKDGVPDFPPIERATAEANADGSLSGGLIVGVPKGGLLSGLTGNVSSVSGTYNGNLVLIGTPTNPIKLDRDIYVKGDVVIKGVVTGRGAIYTERNIYVAGDVTSAKPPDAPGVGVCAGISDKNVCAQKNIADGRDELRLAARGNTVIGDYTERSATGGLYAYDDRQSADYYRNQFGFNGGQRYYDKATGDELQYKNNQYVNVEGQVISGSQVVTKSAGQGNYSLLNDNDAYTYSFRPGNLKADGSFSQWMTDDFYKGTLLGSETFSYNTWRTSLSKNSGESSAAYRDRIKSELLRTDVFSNFGVPATNAASAIACRIAGLSGSKNGCDSSPPSDGAITDNSGRKLGYFNVSGGDLRVMVDGDRNYETQVNRIDAFLYSNWRIAGKVSMQSVALNGGMIAKELGVLAPGRKVETWWAKGYDFLNNPSNSDAACGAAGQKYYVPGTDDCALTVNYDYRLRNGGYGYNIVKGDPGQTIAWRLADQAKDRVK